MRKHFPHRGQWLGANGPAVVFYAVVENAPVIPRHDLHQIRLNFLRAFLETESQPIAGRSTCVSTIIPFRFLKPMAEYDIGGFSTYPGRCGQLVYASRNASVVYAGNGFGGGLEIPRLLPESSASSNQFFDFF